MSEIDDDAVSQEEVAALASRLGPMKEANTRDVQMLQQRGVPAHDAGIMIVLLRLRVMAEMLFGAEEGEDATVERLRYEIAVQESIAAEVAAVKEKLGQMSGLVLPGNSKPLIGR